MSAHPVPAVGDSVRLNDTGLEQCFGTKLGMSHMKTLVMKITYVSPTSMTSPEPSFPVEVDNPEINQLLLDHWCFDKA
ncbi:hypothetical protein LP414_27405 [Polaromonas sp. P1(28)-13]|nr:hypothetical protein LP414_27405 [Polaromonas sp. P1(28)-13]